VQTKRLVNKTNDLGSNAKKKILIAKAGFLLNRKDGTRESKGQKKKASFVPIKRLGDHRVGRKSMIVRRNNEI